MAQPDLIPMPFAENATPGTIEPIPATTPTVPQDATWSTGFPQVTMQPLASGGIPPRGQNFNGVLNALSQHIFHTQGGGQYKWDDAHGPYSIGDVLQSDDGLRAYVSVVDNNTDNFNTNPSAVGTSWAPWSGDAKANSGVSILAGAGLTGGGTLTQNRTLSVQFGTTAGTVMEGNDSRIAGSVPQTRQIIAGSGLTGGGDLSANRALSVNFATTAQAQAMTADNVALTPAKLSAAFGGANQNLASNGYQKLPGGLIIQWGSNSVASGQTILFPVTFPINVRVSVVPGFGSGLTQVYYSVEGTSPWTGFKLNHSASAPVVFNWIAIGY
ncbi:gp53-like domain-containing protein [Methylobacillus sp.]|uniref:gp53-like domain-containing protein n=1 Tax=Methylobacillus sp. TaxID=56818 RepID=UPI002FE3CA2C